MQTNHEQQHAAVGGPALDGGIPRTGFYFDSVEHAYFLDGKPLHGITTVLGVIAKPALIQWAANMAVDYIEAISRVTITLENGNKVREVYQHELKEARVAHRKKKEDAAEKGTDLHALVETYVGLCIKDNGGAPINVFVDKVLMSDPYYIQFEAIKHFINWAVNNKIKFIASEQRLYSKEFWTAGTCDLVFEKDGKTYIGDVKTYKKIWDRTPFFQCAAYGMMWEEMYQPLWDSQNTDNKVEGYCVLRLSKDGTFEDMWSFDIEGDREAFKCALGLYKALKAFKA